MLPKLDDEIYRGQLKDGMLVIVTKGRVLLFDDLIPIKRILLNDIIEVFPKKVSGFFSSPEFSVIIKLRSTFPRGVDLVCPNESLRTELLNQIKMAMMLY